MELFARVAVQRRQVAQLELDAVGAGIDGGVDQRLGPVHRAVVVDPDLGDQQRGATRSDEERTDPQRRRASDRDRGEPAPGIGQRDVLDRRGEPAGQFGHRRVGRSGHEAAVRHVEHPGLEVDGGLGHDPAAEVAVGQHPFEAAVLGHAEDDARPVGVDLLERPLERVFGEHHERGEVAFDDHRGCGPSSAWRCSRHRSARRRSSSVSTSTPSSGSITNRPMRPPSRFACCS